MLMLLARSQRTSANIRQLASQYLPAHRSAWNNSRIAENILLKHDIGDF
jgi:hypothetical protein